MSIDIRMLYRNIKEIPSLTDFCWLSFHAKAYAHYSIWSHNFAIFRYTDYIDFKSELPQQSVPPFCAANLPFSMITMEHLDGLMNRDQLKNSPEKDLNKHIFSEYQLENIGHRIKRSLDKVSGYEYPVD